MPLEFGSASQEKKPHNGWVPMGSVMLAPALGLLVLVIGFIVNTAYIDRPAKRMQEAVFNERQLLETKLVAENLSRHIGSLRDDLAYLATVLLPRDAEPSRGPDTAQFIARPSFQKYAAGLVFLPAGDGSAQSMVPITDAGAAHAQATAWAAEHKLAFLAENRYMQADGIQDTAGSRPEAVRYEIEVHADAENQWLGYVYPVYKGGSLLGVLTAVFDMAALSMEYIQPMRSGKYGAGGLMDDQGTVLYDHEPEAMGINVFSGSHDKYPDLLRFLRDMTLTPFGIGSYTFPRQRGEKLSRKLGAWSRVELGPRFLVVLLSAPEEELEPGLLMLRTQRSVMTAMMIVVIIFMTMVLFGLRQKQLVRVAKKLENEVTQSSTKLQEMSATLYSLLEASPIPVAWTSLSTNRIDYMNKAFSDLLGYTIEDVPTLEQWFIKAYPNPEYRADMMAAWYSQTEHARISGEHMPVSTFKISDARGEEHIVSMFTTVAADKAMTFFTDQTERIKDQERIATSLAEKDTLLRELYHRTKNNLTVIHSLLSIYAHQADSEKVQSVFAEMATRIHSMALAHEMLYKSENLSSINFDEYIRELLELIAGSFSSSRLSIEFDLILEPVRLALEHCIPLGIVLNELLTNSYKHGFLKNPDVSGTLSVYLAVRNGDTLWLKVKDSGTTAPPDFDYKKRANMGILTVSALVTDQLGGTISFDTTNGFSCEINIPYKQP